MCHLFLRFISPFPATFIPMSGNPCYTEQSVPESGMNIPQFFVRCHFTMLHIHYFYVLIRLQYSVCAKWKMCVPHYFCHIHFQICHIHFCFGTLWFYFTGVPSLYMTLSHLAIYVCAYFAMTVTHYWCHIHLKIWHTHSCKYDSFFFEAVCANL
jgi:hypothetical protein